MTSAGNSNATAHHDTTLVYSNEQRVPQYYRQCMKSHERTDMKHTAHLIPVVALFAACSLSAENYSFHTLPDTFYLDASRYSYCTEIQIGQGRVGPVNGNDWDVHIPINRPTWALALAHNHQLLRNYLRFEKFPAEAWLGIALKESSLGCDTAAEWDPSLDKAPVRLWDTRDGFFQLRPDYSSGWGEMCREIFPGRCAISTFRNALHSTVSTPWLEPPILKRELLRQPTI